MSFRPYFLSKAFNEKGHNVVVVSSLNHHLSRFDDKAEGMNEIEDVGFYLVKNNSYTGNGLGRLKNMLGFGVKMFGTRFRKFANLNIPDVIIASTAHPFHVFASYYYAKKYNAKFILEVRDLWPMSLIELVGVSKNHPLIKLISLAQKFGYRNCHKCVSLLSNSKEYLESEGLGAGKFAYIPNGIETKSSSNSSDSAFEGFDIAAKFTQQFNTVIGYTGAVGIPNNMFPLIKAAERLQKDSCGVLIVGDGIEKQKLSSYCQKHNVNNVLFLDPVRKDHVSKMISLCDAMFLNAPPKKIYKYGISPNKAFDYMNENKVVFNGIDAPGNPLQVAGAEILFDGSCDIDLANKIKSFANSKERPIIDTKQYVEHNHSYSVLAQRYITVMQEISSE